MGGFESGEVVQRLNEQDRATNGDVQGGINNGDFSRDEIKDEIWKNLYLKECLLKQKSRQKWLAEGNCNTKYFHAVMRERRRKNAILSIRNGEGEMSEKAENI